MRRIRRFALRRLHCQNLLIILLPVQQALGLFRRHLGNPGILWFAVSLPRFLAVLIFFPLILLGLVLLSLFLILLVLLLLLILLFLLVLLVLLLVLLAGILLLVFL